MDNQGRDLRTARGGVAWPLPLRPHYNGPAVVRPRGGRTDYSDYSDYSDYATPAIDCYTDCSHYLVTDHTLENCKVVVIIIDTNIS